MTEPIGINDSANYSIFHEVKFISERLAEIAYQVLRIDKEPSRSHVDKSLHVNGNSLKANDGICGTSALRSLFNFLKREETKSETSNQTTTTTAAAAINHQHHRHNKQEPLQEQQLLSKSKSQTRPQSQPQHNTHHNHQRQNSYYDRRNYYHHHSHQTDSTSGPRTDRAIYGFIVYLLAKSFFVFYLLWAFIPHSWFCDLGIDFLPDRYWAISIPVFLLTCLTIFASIIYPSMNFCLTPHFNDPRLIPQFDKFQKRWHSNNSNSNHKCTNERDMNESDSGTSVVTNGNGTQSFTNPIRQCRCQSDRKCLANCFANICKHRKSFYKSPELQELHIGDVCEHLYLH